ncbi:YfiT family bacillithiol transferase [Mucilaginibacter ginkgonis]|uniref:Putative metal-dependent hydrolase n=1 Tax=Mucilaginibacter ginkgonis TaxID=2682091 RepID=A0A6I4INU1_9SPHI|nr:putative metal-dependent hydrolase [Mucilaginibacter ginkgonis]QQL48837.1 putative metal-dependent hydrolase [Mucilaginibacter ginkgonis]
MSDEILRYPIGKFSAPVSFTDEEIRRWIDDIKTLPGKVRNAVISLTEDQLNTPYRPGGWTIKQVVHHLADSHMNSLIRFKWALTEDNPVIKTYHEADWALLRDYQLPVESSLKSLEGIHQHMTALFESMSEDEWNRTFFHPEQQREISLKRNLALYSWHSRHHLAHITETKKAF